MKIPLTPPPPTLTQRLPHWMTKAFTPGERNLVNNPIDISSDTSLPLPETLSLPATPSTISQIPNTLFPLNFPTNVDDRYREFLTNKKPLPSDRMKCEAPLPLFGQHLDSNRLSNWALNKLQNRHDIHKDIPEHNLQILTQDNKTFNFELTAKLNSSVHRPLPLAPPNITAQSLPTSFIATELIHKYDRYTKKILG